MPAKKPLADYERKRDFSKTKEPSGNGKRKGKARRKHPRFAFQKHSATSEHYDLRLEVDGVLASWAVPKGPSLDPRDKRLAMRTEDHPLQYLEWEGVIPEGEYGAGPMIVWDRGVFQNISETRRGEPMELADAIAKGDVKLFMLGEKIKGAYALVRTGPPSDREKWLLIKKRDEGADARRRPTSSQPESVLSGRTIEQVLDEEAEPGQFKRHRARGRSSRR
ncbi:MAG TPA: DNA polymerase ligase N-terminal domain-containing protein [Solirubrobacterales bacterium]